MKKIAIALTVITILITFGCERRVIQPISRCPACKGDSNLNGIAFEISDVILVSRRIDVGYCVWAENGTSDDSLQEYVSDLDFDQDVDNDDLDLFLAAITYPQFE